MSKLIRISGHYSSEDAELIGNPESLRDLSELLAADTPSTICNLINPPTLSLLPSEKSLTALQVIHTESMVVIMVKQDTLIIEGKKEKLGLLAQNIRFLADLPKSTGKTPNHTHVEYFPNHFYLAPSSFSLIVTVDEKM